VKIIHIMKVPLFFLIPLPCGQPCGFFAGGGGSWAWALSRTLRRVAAGCFVAREHVSTCRNQKFISLSPFFDLFPLPKVRVIGPLLTSSFGRDSRNRLFLVM